MGVKETKFWFWLVRKLPVTLVYFSFMHVMAHSTTGVHGNTMVPELTGMDAAERYAKDKGIH